MTRVLLLNMPWVSASRPAIGISLLKARLAEEGVECVVGYPNLLLADRIGISAYELVDDKLSSALFAGDWLFADHMFGERLDRETYLNTLRANAGGEENFDAFISLRSHIAPFLEECFERFAVGNFDIIGFTTTFEQNMASLALARMIKERYPEKIVVFGGGNCEGVMGIELHRSFPWIDYVCSGESDYSFPELVARLAQNKPVEGTPGVVVRSASGSRLSAASRMVQDMDALPDPDYSDYFAALESVKIGSSLKPVLLFESARGCWWGAKSHCTFCGLNGDSMAFRAKSAQRVLEEMDRQEQRHGITRFVAVDNIMSHEYFKTFLPALKQRRNGRSLFYEIKSNLRPQQIQLLRDAGVTAVQPGIESLSTHVLKLMGKGVTAIQNIQLLKFCREYGIESAWNLLYGFPGETPEDYRDTARAIESLYHLKPPGVVSAIRLDRFSPNFNRADAFGLTRVRPFALYRYIYPLPDDSIANIAYFFEYDYADGRKPDDYLKETAERVRVWQENRTGDLLKEYGETSELTLIDTRPGHTARCFPLNGVQREVYEFCDEIQSWSSIVAFVESRAPGQPEQQIREFVESLVANGLMFREGNQYLSLAVSKQATALPGSQNGKHE